MELAPASVPVTSGFLGTSAGLTASPTEGIITQPRVSRMLTSMDIPGLVLAVKPEHPRDARLLAVKSLGNLTKVVREGRVYLENSVFSALSARLDEKDEDVVRAALDAMRKLTDERHQFIREDEMADLVQRIAQILSSVEFSVGVRQKAAELLHAAARFSPTVLADVRASASTCSLLSRSIFPLWPYLSFSW